MAMEAYAQNRQYRNPLSLKEYWSTAKPTASTDIGPFSVGDIVWNTVPAAGGATYMGWVCTTAGKDGANSTWKGFGLIET
jgi:hypothetical protein